jgi:hypothetical protein
VLTLGASQITLNAFQAPIDVLNWGQPIGEDWNVSSVNTIQVPKRKIIGILWCIMLKNFKSSIKIKGRV